MNHKQVFRKIGEAYLKGEERANLRGICSLYKKHDIPYDLHILITRIIWGFIFDSDYRIKGKRGNYICALTPANQIIRGMFCLLLAELSAKEFRELGG